MRKNTLINLAGLLLALAIASGGLLGVQARLAVEKAKLLQESGTVELPVQSGPAQSGEVSDQRLQRLPLTEDDLMTVVKSLESGAEIYPHEPSGSQLTMAEAVEYGLSWLEDFCMPHLGVTDFHMTDYKTGCYLWTTQEDVPLLSYWTVSLSTKSMEAELVLNAVSGQILDASVRCSLPLLRQDPESMMTFVNDYAASFGLGEEYTLIREDTDDADSDPDNTKISGQTIYQSVGSQGIFAAMSMNGIVVSKAGSDGGPEDASAEYAELLSLRLRLTQKIIE